MFCSSLNIIFLLSTFIFLLLESVGIWFLNNRVNIPPSSMQAAIWVYQLSVLTCIVNLISIPYNALVIAHEKMDAYALISIIQVNFMQLLLFQTPVPQSNYNDLFSLLLDYIQAPTLHTTSSKTEFFLYKWYNSCLRYSNRRCSSNKF